MQIQKIFTEIRNCLNEREDKILLEVDEQFNNIYFKEDIIKKSEKLPIKMKESLEKGKILNKWDENNHKLNSLINDCINIENNIKDISIINENITKFNTKKIEINFNPEKFENNDFLESIKKFGSLEIKNNEDDINKKEQKNKKKNKFGKLLKEENIELLTNWIKSDNQQIKSINFELCYDAKINGDDKNNFHKFCENVGPSILVIKTESNYIFGGYTREN